VRLDFGPYRGGRRGQDAVVVVDRVRPKLHHHVRRRDVRDVFDFHGRRRVGVDDSGRMGVGHHELRVLDRYRPRGNTDFRDLVFAAPALAHVDQPRIGSDDDLCGYLRGLVSADPYRARLVRVVALAATELQRLLAAIPLALVVGRIRGIDVFHGVAVVLVHGFDPGPCDHALSREDEDSADSVWDWGIGLDRLEPPLE